MPFTPLHMGPGLVFKAIGGKRFSLITYGVAQVLIDIEPLVGILTNSTNIHGFSHTIFGAYVIALGAMFASSLLYPKLDFWVALASSYIGVYTHLFLDAIMHADMRPFYPITEKNPLMSLVEMGDLDWMCGGSFILAGAYLLIINMKDTE